MSAADVLEALAAYGPLALERTMAGFVEHLDAEDTNA